MSYKTFKTSSNMHYVYEANRNSIYRISELEYEALSNTEHSCYSMCDKDILTRFNKKGLLKSMEIDKIEHNNSEMLKLQFNKGVNNIVLQITQGCNLSCSYCPFADGNKIYKSHRKHHKKDMDIEIIKKSIDLLENNSTYNSKKYISFYGGEPLLREDLVEFAVEEAINRFGKDMVYFGLTTNGTLLTEDFIEKIKDVNFTILVSLDGPEEIHDVNRKFKDGKGSFSILNANLDIIREKYPNIYDEIRFNVVIPPGINYAKVFDFIRDGSNHLTLRNTSLNTISSNYAEENIEYEDDFFEEANYEMVKTLLLLLGMIREDITKYKGNIEKIYMFKKFLTPLMSTKGVQHPAGTCIPGLKKLFINVYGDFYPCEKANELSKIQKIGSIYDGFDFEKIKYLMNIGKSTSEICKNCWAFHLCSICPISADDGYSDTYVADYKLKKCKFIKQDILANLRMYCFLKERGFDYKEEY